MIGFPQAMIGGDTETIISGSVALVSNGTPFVWAWPWSDAGGFGTKYSNPGSLPPSSTGVVYAPDGRDIFVASASAPTLSAYPWDDVTGFGTKYSNPASPTQTAGNQVAVHPSGADVVVSGSTTSAFLDAYPFTHGTGFGVRYSTPSSPPGANSRCIAFNNAGTLVGATQQTSPYIKIWHWTQGSGFGAAFSNPGVTPSITTPFGCAFSPDGGAFMVCGGGSPFVQAYVITGTAFGSLYSDPGTLPATTLNGLAFTIAGDAVVFGQNNATGIIGYPWSDAGGFGTKYSNPVSLPNTGQRVSFNASGTAVAVANGSSPGIFAYPFDAVTGFGTKYTNASPNIASTSIGVNFNGTRY